MTADIRAELAAYGALAEKASKPWWEQVTGPVLSPEQVEDARISRTVGPRAARALAAALGVHKPVTYWRADDDPQDIYLELFKTREEAERYLNGDKPVIEVRYCEACMKAVYDLDEGDSVSDGGYPDYTRYPCATVRAITEAWEDGR